MQRRLFYVLCLVALSLLIVTGCSGGDDQQAGPIEPVQQPNANNGNNTNNQQPEAPVKEPEPEDVELNMFIATGLSDDEFKRFIQEPVKAQYPHITINPIQSSEALTRENLTVSGQSVDLIYDSRTDVWEDMQMLEPITEYIKKNNFDTNVIAPGYAHTARETGEWKSFPFSGNFVLNWLNLDIFELFGVDPPLELVTWDELIDISIKLTREENGIQYIGMWPDYHFMARGMSQNQYIDVENMKATVNNEHIKRFFQVSKRAYEVPGYIKEDGTWRYRRNEWLRDQNVAMVTATANQMMGPLKDLADAGTPMNWDMSPFPNFPEKLGTAPADGAQEVILAKISNHKDEAFKVMMAMLSEEAQTQVSRSGRKPVIVNKNAENQYGADFGDLQGKNVAAIFMTTPAEPEVGPTDINDIGKKALNKAIERFAKENIDINTLLRETEEQINAELAELVASQ